MPEYLAPGVYVEETSFRAKSIEGVGTSTTAFVGPTLKGPVGGTPELLTSFGDFERIYGGLDALSYGTNYLAHAVRAFFNEGGSRLYVSRAAPPAGSGAVPASVTAGGTVRFVARTAGTAGNGRITLRLQTTPATQKTLENAPVGTVARRGVKPATPARLTGGVPPFAVPNDSTLRLVVGSGGANGNLDVKFHGETATAAAASALPDMVNLTDTNTTLQVTIDGVAQTLTLPTAATPRAEFVDNLNQQLRGGFARLTVAADAGGADRLVFGSDRRGRAAQVVVAQNAELGFTAAANVLGTATAANNVGDIGAVTVDEIDALLAAAGVDPRKVRAVVNRDGRLEFVTAGTGVGATLTASDQGVGTAALGGLGVAIPANAKAGEDGVESKIIVKRVGGYVESGGLPFDLTTVTATSDSNRAEILSLSVVAEDRSGTQAVYDDLGFEAAHPRYVGTVLAPVPKDRADQIRNLYAFEAGAGVTEFNLWQLLFPSGPEAFLPLTNGSDGAAQPGSGDYETALQALEQLTDVSIVASPGSSAHPTDAQAIQ
ncbi:MAG TPA: hypothetical protein VMZ71_06280, partial [Gemmataceae bacterium]|nr:hypothetical protein [Gemmataceae bacterium]